MYLQALSSYQRPLSHLNRTETALMSALMHDELILIFLCFASEANNPIRVSKTLGLETDLGICETFFMPLNVVNEPEADV